MKCTRCSTPCILKIEKTTSGDKLVCFCPRCGLEQPKEPKVEFYKKIYNKGR